MCELSDERDWWWEKLGLALVGRALLSKALIQLSADGWGCTPSLEVVWPERPSPVYGLYGRVNGDLQEGFHQRAPSQTTATCVPVPVVSPADPHLNRKPFIMVLSSVGSLFLFSRSWCA